MAKGKRFNTLGRSIENSCIAGARFQEVCFITNAMKFQVRAFVRSQGRGLKV